MGKRREEKKGKKKQRKKNTTEIFHLFTVAITGHILLTPEEDVMITSAQKS